MGPVQLGDILSWGGDRESASLARIVDEGESNLCFSLPQPIGNVISLKTRCVFPPFIRKIRCDGGDVCSNCSRASRHCEYTAVTEESTRRERDFPQRRRGNASTETGVPIPSAYASNILGSPMSDWSPPSEYLNLPISGTSVGGSGFDGPVPTWSNGNSPAIGYQRSVELNSPAIPQSPSINQRGFQQTSYPTSSLSGYGGQPSSWQPTHATSSSSSSNRSIGRHFPNVSIGTPRHETQCGVIGSTDTFYMGHDNSSSSNEDYYRPQLSRMSTFPVLNTPRHTPNSRSTSPHSKAKATSYSSFSALVSPPQTPIFEVQPFNYAINPSELQTFKGMSGLNIRVPVPLTTSMVNDDGMRHLFAGVPGLESAAPVVDQTRPPPPPYSIMA